MSSKENRQKPAFQEINWVRELTPEQQAVLRERINNFWQVAMPTGGVLKKLKNGLRVVPNKKEKNFFQRTPQEKDFNI